MKIDLHIHTFHSPDSLSRYDAIIRRVEARGLDAIAITDHNLMRGAFELARIAPFPVIIGEEIRTCEGEIIGYFLQEEIPRGLELEATIERIREQGGVVAVPHPVDRVRKSSAIGEEALLRIMNQVDIIEGLNARCFLHQDNLRAQRIARAHDKPLSAGSDAHAPVEIGRAYIEIEPFDSARQFLLNLKSARLHGGRSAGWVSVFSTFAKLAKKSGLSRWISS
jgi:predicted metal-dependent phosphoesterase TrpH